MKTNEKNNETLEEKSGSSHSKLNITSYAGAEFIMQIFSVTFSAYVFYFYEAEIGLQSWLAALGFIIYAIWNAINDPLVGIFCDRPFFFTKRWGRRFPWIICSIFPSILFYLLVFAPPNVDPIEGQWILFGWLVFATCLLDTTISFWGVNYWALFVDKFRNLDERRTASGIINMFAYLGLTFGSLVPPFFINYGVKESFLDQAWALVIVALIASVFTIPGLREDPKTINRYLSAYGKQKEKGKKISLLHVLKVAFHQKNFVVYIILFLGYSILRACLLGSLQYGLRYVLKVPAIYSTIIMGAYVIFSLISIPIWTILIKKIDNNKKIMIIGAVMSCIFTFPMSFLADLISWIIILSLWAIGIAGMFVAKSPLFADVIDENIVLTKERNEGFFNGIYLFIVRFSTVFQALIFAIVHEATGFVEGADTQSATAILGIQLAMGFIPMLFLLFGTILFWKYYDLTPERINENKRKLEELEL